MPAKSEWLMPKSNKIRHRLIAKIKYRFLWITEKLQFWVAWHLPAYTKLLVFYIVCSYSVSDVGNGYGDVKSGDIADAFKKLLSFLRRSGINAC
jgi:hypothetical protein